MLVPTGHAHRSANRLLTSLRAVGLFLAAPFLLVLVFGASISVLVDFTFFRLRSAITGEPHPKGVWEF